jgi:DNA-binding MarR family transcriptional regulator
MNITAEQIATEIRRHSRQLVRELTIVNGSYLDTGYTISQCHVMFELSLNTSLNLMELSEALLTDKSNTSRTVKKLVEIGLVNAEKVSTDQRQKRFSLTQRGVKALRGITSLANKQVETALENLSQEQRLRVIDGMQLYASALSLENGVRYRKPERPEGCFAFSVPDPVFPANPKS